MTEPTAEAAVTTDQAIGDRSLLLEVRKLTKRFGGLVGIDGIDFDLRLGEIHCVLGENGAGKTTLMNVIYGLHVPDSGQILVRGQPVTIRSPREAIGLRIGMVHQNFMLIRALSVLENIVLGSVGLAERLHTGQHAAAVRRLVRDYGFDIDVDSLVSSISLGQRQQVEILKALYRRCEILILDEPTSILSPIEVEQLFLHIRHLAEQGAGIVVITHKLHEVLAIGDRNTVLRGGRVVGQSEGSATTREELTHWMFGDALVERADRKRIAKVRSDGNLDVDHLCVQGDEGRPAVNDVSFQLRSGEILGLAGVSGNGQLELAEAIGGVRAPADGWIQLEGQTLEGLNPRHLRRLGVVYIAEEREAGLALELSMQDNLVLADFHSRPYSRYGVLRWSFLRQLASELANAFRLTRERMNRPVKRLSGGNQQRVVLARSLARQPSVLVASQATQGLDFAATEYVHDLVRSLRDQGVGVLYVSTDLDELLGLADRIGVMFHGRLAAVVERSEFSRRAIGYLMTTGEVPS